MKSLATLVVLLSLSFALGEFLSPRELHDDKYRELQWTDGDDDDWRQLQWTDGDDERQLKRMRRSLPDGGDERQLKRMRRSLPMKDMKDEKDEKHQGKKEDDDTGDASDTSDEAKDDVFLLDGTFEKPHKVRPPLEEQEHDLELMLAEVLRQMTPVEYTYMRSLGMMLCRKEAPDGFKHLLAAIPTKKTFGRWAKPFLNTSVIAKEHIDGLVKMYFHNLSPELYRDMVEGIKVSEKIITEFCKKLPGMDTKQKFAAYVNQEDHKKHGKKNGFNDKPPVPEEQVPEKHGDRHGEEKHSLDKPVPEKHGDKHEEKHGEEKHGLDKPVPEKSAPETHGDKPAPEMKA